MKKGLSGRPVTELEEPGAGYLVDFFVPNLPLTSTTSPDITGTLLDVGGTVQGDALGRLDAWPAVLKFLDDVPSCTGQRCGAYRSSGVSAREAAPPGSRQHWRALGHVKRHALSLLDVTGP